MSDVLRKTGRLFKLGYGYWRDDNAARLGAALSYYTIFSLPPLMVLLIAIAGFAFGDAAAQGRIVGEVQGLIGPQGAKAVQYMVVKASAPRQGVIASAIGLLFLVLGATGAFAELQSSMDHIWKSARNPGRRALAGVVNVVKKRLMSLLIVLIMGALLMAFLVFGALVSGFAGQLNALLPGVPVSGLLHLLDLLITFGAMTMMFAIMFKVLPEADITWGDVWVGGAVTSALFTVGKYLIGLYLGSTATASVYGAAGSVVLILLWVYYSSLILFFGIEFTRAYAEEFGSRATRGGRRGVKEA